MKVLTKRLSIKVLAILLLGVLSLGGLFLHNGVKTAAAETIESVKATDLLDTTAKVTQDENGLCVSSDTPYEGTFDSTFMGDTTFKFTFPEEFKDAYYGDFTFRVTDAKDENNYFDITYYVTSRTSHYTGLYVKYEKELRMVFHTGRAWYNVKKENYVNSRVAPSFFSYCGPDGTMNGDRVGILSLVWNDGVLSIQANSPNIGYVATKMVTQAAFDGTYDTGAPNNGFVDQKAWGLPKLDFEDGYKISISSSFEYKDTTDKATDVCFKEIAGVDFLTTTTVTPSYTYKTTFENAVVSGDNVYIPQNEEIGKIALTYVCGYGNGGWGMKETVNINESIDVSTVGTKDFTITNDAWKDTPLGAISKTYKVHVETPYTLTFDVQGGEAIEKIVHSDHTENRISVSNPQRLFWKFDGWYIGDKKWSGKESDLYGKDVTLTAHWLDLDAPTIFLNGVNDKTYQTKGTTVTIGQADVVAGDDAQNDKIVITLALKKPNENAFTAITDAYALTLDTIGSYVIQYTVTDPAGYTATCERSIEVFERNAPTLTVEEGYAKYANLESKVNFAMATAKNADGEELEITISVVKDGKLIENDGKSFVPTEMGEYTVTLFTADKAPYDKLQSIYTYAIVVIQDDVAPEIGNEFTDITVKRNTQVTIPTITVTDNISENVTLEVFVYYGTQKIELTNNSFKADQEGSYRVLLVAKDGAGNRTEKTVYVTVPAEATNGGCGCSCSNASGGLGLPMGLLMLAGSFVFCKNIMMKKMGRKENI